MVVLDKILTGRISSPKAKVAVKRLWPDVASVFDEQFITNRTSEVCEECQLQRLPIHGSSRVLQCQPLCHEGSW